MKKIQKIDVKMPKLKEKKKVAAYARVSAAKGRTLHSLSQQVSYYNEKITSNGDWQFAGVYSDLGISGVTSQRNDFRRMLKDCEEGKIDLILTKSISRFARNTVDLLEIVRHLKDIGVEVHFEKENIKTFSGDGELMLSILASFAQEEAMSISNNVKWRIKKKFEEGKGNNFVLYCYRWDGEKFNLVDEEAEVVKYCFKNFLDGKSAETAAKELAEWDVRGLNGGPISPASIRAILRQEKYTGNSLLQKTYTDFITKKEIKNKGNYLCTGPRIPTLRLLTLRSLKMYKRKLKEDESLALLPTGLLTPPALPPRFTAPVEGTTNVIKETAVQNLVVNTLDGCVPVKKKEIVKAVSIQVLRRLYLKESVLRL